MSVLTLICALSSHVMARSTSRVITGKKRDGRVGEGVGATRAGDTEASIQVQSAQEEQELVQSWEKKGLELWLWWVVGWEAWYLRGPA